MYIYCVECFTHVQCSRDGACGLNRWVETCCDSVADVVQRCLREAFGLEPALCCDIWHVLCYVRKNHPLECPCNNRQKGYRPVLRPNVDVFRDRYDVGQFPNMRYLVVVDMFVRYCSPVLPIF